MAIYKLDVFLFLFGTSLFFHSSSNCCFLTCILVSQWSGKEVSQSGENWLKVCPSSSHKEASVEVFEENFGPRSQTERPRNEGTGARKANTPPAWLAKCPGPWWQLSSVSSAMHRAWCGSSSFSLWGLIEKAFVIVLAPEKSPRFLSRSQTPQFTLQYSHQ